TYTHLGGGLTEFFGDLIHDAGNRSPFFSCLFKNVQVFLGGRFFVYFFLGLYVSILRPMALEFGFPPSGHLVELAQDCFSNPLASSSDGITEVFHGGRWRKRVLGDPVVLARCLGECRDPLAVYFEVFRKGVPAFVVEGIQENGVFVHQVGEIFQKILAAAQLVFDFVEDRIGLPHFSCAFHTDGAADLGKRARRPFGQVLVGAVPLILVGRGFFLGSVPVVGVGVRVPAGGGVAAVLPRTRISGVTTVLPGTRILLAVAVPAGSAVRLVAVVAAAAGGAVARVGAARGAIVVPPAGATVVPLAGTAVVPLARAGVLLGSVPPRAVVAGVLARAALAGVPTSAVLTATRVLARSHAVGGLVAPVRGRGGRFLVPTNGW